MRKKKEVHEPIVYVGIISFGYGDSSGTMIIYAGLKHEIATTMLKGCGFPEPENNFAYIEHWQDGVKIKTEYVIS